MKNKIKMWVQLKMIIFQFNYYNTIYNKNLNKFFTEEQEKLRTIKNSFEFHSYRTGNVEKIQQELSMFKTLICYRLKQKKYNFS